MNLRLHQLTEGEYVFPVDDYRRDSGDWWLRVGSTLHIGSNPMRIIETVAMDEQSQTVTVRVRYSTMPDAPGCPEDYRYEDW